jgi:16S rRNA (uracil1498-N3)-methyltransferase
MSERYYVNSPLGPGPLVLSGAEAYHLATVCRGRPGDVITLFCGDGTEFSASVVEVDKNRVVLDLQQRLTPHRELEFHLEIAAALPKGDRADFLIEKLTELGVARFVPLATARSVVRPRLERLDRFRRAVIEASKQCGRNILMHIEPLIAWNEYICRPGLPAGRWVVHPGGEARQNLVGDAAFAIGPEGGFTDEELAAAEAAGWRSLDLGPRILRVETAAVCVASRASQRTMR